MGGESSLPLRLGQLEGAAQLVQRVPAHYGPDQRAVRFQELLDLKPVATASWIHSVLKGGDTERGRWRSEQLSEAG